MADRDAHPRAMYPNPEEQWYFCERGAVEFETPARGGVSHFPRAGCLGMDIVAKPTGYQDLCEAIGRFGVEPLGPGPGDKPMSYYVERAGYRGAEELDVIERIQGLLTASTRSHVKVFLSGHRGTGKSTELNRLAAADVPTASLYEIVSVGTLAGLNFGDVSISHVLLLVADALRRRVEEWKALARLDATAVAPLFDELAEKLRAVLPRETVDKEVSLSLLGVVSARLKTNQPLRQSLTDLLGGRVEELAELVNIQVDVLREVTGRPVLLIVDGLDRVRPEYGGQKLFTLDLPALLLIRAPVIYTIPIDIFYDPSYSDLHGQPQRRALPHVKLYVDETRRAPFEPGWSLMKAIVGRRLSVERFDSEVLDELIRLSGGSIRELCRGCGWAAEYACLKKRAMIDAPALAFVRREMRLAYESLIAADEIRGRLRTLHTTRQLGDNFDLLPSLVVREYQNGGSWYALHPIVEEILFPRADR